MTSLEELMESERQAVEPKPEDIDRVGRRVMTAVGMGTAVGVGAAMVTTAATAKGGAAVLSKVAGFLGTKVTVGWALAAVAAGGTATFVAEHMTGDPPGAAPQHWVDQRAVAVSERDEEHPRNTDPAEDERAARPEKERRQAPVAADQAPDGEASGTGTREAPRSDHPPSKSASHPADASERLRRDARLLSRVTAELNSGNHARAISLMDQASLAGSPLSAEFAAVRAVALCSTGRHAEAAPWLAQFREQSPKSPAARRVRRACGPD